MDSIGKLIIIIAVLAILFVIGFWLSCIHWTISVFVISVIVIGFGRYLIGDEDFY